MTTSPEGEGPEPLTSEQVDPMGNGPGHGAAGNVALTFPQLSLRIALFAVLIWLASGYFGNVTFQTLLAWGLVLGFLVTYRKFLGSLSRYLLAHPNQSLILIVFFCLLYGLIGAGYGLPNLFWYETPRGRVFSAIGSTLLLAVLGINAYYLDDEAKATRARVDGFLDDWKIKYPFESFWQMLDPPVHPNTGERLNSGNVSRFLRLARFPFLTLISLPALFPLAFPFVPRLAPDQ